MILPGSNHLLYIELNYTFIPPIIMIANPEIFLTEGLPTIFLQLSTTRHLLISRLNKECLFKGGTQYKIYQMPRDNNFLTSEVTSPRKHENGLAVSRVYCAMKTNSGITCGTGICKRNVWAHRLKC